VGDTGGGYSERGLALAWATRSDVGLRRSANEDSVLAEPPVFAVADGMGGHAAGDRASAAVVARLHEATGAPATDVAAIVAALSAARLDIDAIAEGIPVGVGTTVTGVAVVTRGEEPALLVFNVGDSRTYALRDGRLDRLTVDHSVVQELVDAGVIDAAQAEHHPESNVITRAIGFREEPRPDLWLVPARGGERLLLCSDGLTKEVPEPRIAELLAAGEDADATAQLLLDAALEAGGSDNVSVVVVDVTAAPDPAEPWEAERVDPPAPPRPESSD